MKTQPTAPRLSSVTFLLAFLMLAAAHVTMFGQAIPSAAPTTAPAATTPNAPTATTPSTGAPATTNAAAPAPAGTQAPATPNAPAPSTPDASAPTTPPATASAATPGDTNNPAQPPSAPAQKSDADLDKLVGPIALFPDPLLATVLPASAYPLEIVQAARFVKDTNNIAKLDTQPWDDNVKAVARFPDVINQMNDNIQWTSDLGDAFINQPKGVTDAIQRMRTKAEGSGALKSTEQQVVTTTNLVVTNVVQQQTVVVTNQVVQIQPSTPDVIYVPQYNPTVVYGGYPAAYPGYVYPPSYPVAGAAITFGLGMAAGAIVANNCDWGHGGAWGGHYHGDVDINRNVNVNANRNTTVNRTGNANVNQQKWQPDQNRIKNSGSTMSSAQSREARGYGTGNAGAASTTPRTAAGGNTAATRPSTTAPRDSAGGTGAGSGTAAGNRQSTPGGTANTGTRQTTPGASANTGARQTTPGASASGSAPSTGSGTARGSEAAASRTSASGSSGSGSSAFSGGGGGGGAQARAASSRGSASRAGGGGGRGGGGRR